MAPRDFSEMPLPPKKALTAYLCFRVDQFDEFKKRYPNKKITELGKIMGDHWKKLRNKTKYE